MSYWWRIDDYEEPDYPPGPWCDICKRHTAVSEVNGYYVCCADCAAEAEQREPKKESAGSGNE